ncbi:MAG: hypothetical protein WA738_11550, partial [Candidatus Angelobacter sp.]
MGVSKSYTIFAGAVEMLGGALLFLPRLTMLGALVAVGAMTNVFILNMSYDVPVKLYSFHLLIFGAFLLLPEMRRLARFFVFNRSTEPAPAELTFHRKWLQGGFLIAQLAFGSYIAGSSLYFSHKQLKSFTHDYSVQPPLLGIWSVDEFAIDGQPRPPLLTDEVRWQKAIFEYKTGLTIEAMDSKLLRYGAKIDPDKKTVALIRRSDANWKTELTYALPTPQTMIVDGTLGGQKVHIKLHHIENTYLLNTRGFHWINEFPYNR